MQGKENYAINSDSMLNAAQGVGRVSTQAGDAGSSMTGSFSGLSSLNGKAVGEIAKQTSLLGDAMSSWQNIIVTNVNKGLDYDNKMAEVAGDIEIPVDYTTNNSMDTNTYNSIYITKEDDTSVNEGEQTEKVGDLDENTVAAETIFDINKNQTQKEEYNDATTIIGESILGNINKDQTQKEEYDDSTSVGNKKLKDITTDQTQKEEYNDSSSVNEEVLENINKNQTEQQTYDDKSNVRNKVISDISGNQTQKQSYDGSTVIGNSILGSINSNAKTQQQSLDDDAIVASVVNGPSAEIKEIRTNDTEKVNEEPMEEIAEVKLEEQEKDEQVA